MLDDGAQFLKVWKCGNEEEAPRNLSNLQFTLDSAQNQTVKKR